MLINYLQSQKFALDRSFNKSYEKLFSTHLNTINSISQNKLNKQDSFENSSLDQTREMNYNLIQEASDKFYKEYKTLRNEYEHERYKLDIQEAPSIHTMTSAINYKQKILFEEMNERIAAEQKRLKDKILSGRYNFLEEIALKNEFEEFKSNLQETVSKEISDFRASYHDALVNRNSSRIDELENSLLSNILSKL